MLSVELGREKEASDNYEKTFFNILERWYVFLKITALFTNYIRSYYTLRLIR